MLVIRLDVDTFVRQGVTYLVVFTSLQTNVSQPQGKATTYKETKLKRRYIYKMLCFCNRSNQSKRAKKQLDAIMIDGKFEGTKSSVAKFESKNKRVDTNFKNTNKEMCKELESTNKGNIEVSWRANRKVVENHLSIVKVVSKNCARFQDPHSSE